MELFEKGKQVSCMLWSEMWLSMLNLLDKIAFFGQDFVILMVDIKSSTVKHARARIGYLATQDTRNGRQQSYYYSPIVYSKSEVPCSGKALGEGLMSATKHEFQSLAILLN